jgi:hypothetical protein
MEETPYDRLEDSHLHPDDRLDQPTRPDSSDRHRLATTARLRRSFRLLGETLLASAHRRE